MSVDTLTIVTTQIVTTLGIVYFLIQRMDRLAQRTDDLGRVLRKEFREQLEAQGRHLGARIDALTARFDAHLERHST